MCRKGEEEEGEGGRGEGETRRRPIREEKNQRETEGRKGERIYEARVVKRV